MLIAARDGRSFVENISWEEFRRSKLHQYAVRLALQIIGEAARGVSSQTQDLHPEIA